MHACCIRYVKMNASLRLVSLGLSAEHVHDKATAMHLKGNRYVNSIYACTSGMVKTSRASRIPRGRKVYRGIAGVRLPEHLIVAGEDGGRGGVEFGFMSTTTSKVRGRTSYAHTFTFVNFAAAVGGFRSHSGREQEVAVNYINAGKGLPTLFEFEVGAIDRGTPLSFLSQFPGEDEILIPAMSFLEVTGAPFTMHTSKGSVTVYPARINCNLKSQTIEQIEARRRTELLAQAPYLEAEFKRDVPPVLEALKRHAAFSNCMWKLDELLSDSRKELATMWATGKSRATAWCGSTISRAALRKHAALRGAVWRALQCRLMACSWCGILTWGRCGCQQV